MDYIFDDNQPIYLQIKQRICADILRRKYSPGDKLPGIVETAMQFKVNHNTIQRVYQELIREGVAISKRGEGTFVTEDTKVLKKMETELQTYAMEGFIEEMVRLGYQEGDLAQIIEQYIHSRQVKRKEE
ncbi:MAG TPA: GntR family transcriptional regulator [Anaerolineaceae bacterium]|jgi:GntR family transcriptional regulator|nr:GntR family transcriptional regulator [Anaerolineaceae bacterium]